MKSGKDLASIFCQDERYNSSKQEGDASFRVLYYGGAAGSVPFMWESQPGTPKHKLGDSPLPPLTPPPQYQSSPLASPSLKKKQPKIFNSIFARISSKKMSSPTSSSSSSYSSSYSSPSTPLQCYGGGNSKARLGSISYFEDENEVGKGSPTSTLCFSDGNGRSSNKSYYFYPIKSVKKMVKAIAGRR